MKRIALVVFNLGGPDRPEAVEPFLFNLFNDAAIIALPWPLRPLLARLVSRRRAQKAQGIYAQIGGGSPIVPETQLQLDALVAALSDLGEVKGFMAMRYWHPRAAESVAAVKAFAPDHVVLVPLYPQFSTTTSASSLDEWSLEAKKAGLTAPSHALCCYPTDEGFIAANADLIAKVLAQAEGRGAPRLLFSAHGLPRRVVESGDPYQAQVEATASAIMAHLGREDLDWVVCYQSRVGPLKWIGPSSEEEILRAGSDGVPVVMVPLSFVSEHSETLVELDIDYAARAKEVGVPHFSRVATVRDHPAFIAGLDRMVRQALREPGLRCGLNASFCEPRFQRCPQVARS